MAGTYPTTPAPIAVDYSITSPTFHSETHSGRVVTRDRGGAGRFQLEFKYPAMTRETFAPLWAFLVKQHGRAETFTVVNPAITLLGTGSGTPLVNGAHTAGDATINTKGWAATSTVLKAGDIITFADGGKVYVITADETTDGGGFANLGISPPLITDIAADATIQTSSVKHNVSLMSDFTTVSVDHCRIHGGLVVTMRERV